VTQETIARLERLEAEAALLRLANNYCHGIDRQDLERLMSVWHEDAIYVTNTPGIGTIVGKVEIARVFTEIVWPSLRASVHSTTNFTTDIRGDRATALSNTSYIGIAGDGRCLVPLGPATGTYSDIFERRNGIWRFASRTIGSVG
jgi:ketosteroid isomerase-like protein